MNVDKVKYNLEFGQFSYGRLFIEKYKELSLDISLLGKYFSFKNEQYINGLPNCISQLIGLVEKKTKKIESIKNNKIHYKIGKTEYSLLFKIIQSRFNPTESEVIGYINAEISDFNKDFELME